MNYSCNVQNDWFSEVNDGGFLAKVLGVAYDSTRFKQYASDIKANKGSNEDAANKVIWQTASKMTIQGVSLGLPGGLLEIAIEAADIASLLYHIVEMCGVLAEIYGLDTSDDKVKPFVLAGVTGNIHLMDQAYHLLLAESPVTDVIKTSVIVPILTEIGVKVGITGGMKTAAFIPIVGAVIDGGTNFWMVNDTGHKFLKKLKEINK